MERKIENTYRVGANRWYIANAAIAGKTKIEALSSLRDLVDSGTLTFKRNPTREEKAAGITHRIPLESRTDQIAALKGEIGRVYAELGLAIGKKFEDKEIPAEPDDEPKPETPIAKGKDRIRQELLYFRRRVREIRAFCESRAANAESVDWISVRPAQAAAKLIPAGIPADALLHTLALHWSADTRREAGINHYDIPALSKRIMAERGITEIHRKSGKVEEPHALFGYILVLAENRIPIALVGEFGIGKSHVLPQIAEYLGVDYGETPMSLGATRGDLLGRFTASPERPFIPARFNELFGKGGLFNFEELDAADPGMLIVLNNALAADVFYNSSSGETIKKHPDFIAASTMNTFGYGANRRYNAREKLDEATLDRWRMGRVWVTLDENVEDFILGL